jgi:hypothetical protein
MVRPILLRGVVSIFGACKPVDAWSDRVACVAAEHRKLAVERHYLGIIDTRRLLCNSYVQLCIALEKAGIIKVPKRVFGTEENRYAQRYECFKVFLQSVYVPFEIMEQRLDCGGAFPCLGR